MLRIAGGDPTSPRKRGEVKGGALLTSKILYASIDLSRFTGAVLAKAVLLCMGLFSTFLSARAEKSSIHTSFIPVPVPWAGSRRGISLMHISNEGLLVILFVGLVAGWLAGKVVRGTGFGIIGDIVVGIAGALVASFLFPKLGIRIGTGLVSEIVYSAIGAVILLLVVRLVRGGGRF
jgi:uncharacterized membrane protein YeaQ/YmgE (transglycosylase-associated protein family)